MGSRRGGIQNEAREVTAERRVDRVLLKCIADDADALREEDAMQQGAIWPRDDGFEAMRPDVTLDQNDEAIEVAPARMHGRISVEGGEFGRDHVRLRLRRGIRDEPLRIAGVFDDDVLPANHAAWPDDAMLALGSGVGVSDQRRLDVVRGVVVSEQAA